MTLEYDPDEIPPSDELTARERLVRAVLRVVLRPVAVDLLPRRLWWSGNMHYGFRLHFCYGAYRIVEFDGEEIARGRRLVTVAELEDEPDLDERE